MWLHIQIGVEKQRNFPKTMPTSGHATLFLDTPTHTPHPLPGLTASDLLATGLVDFRWL